MSDYRRSSIRRPDDTAPCVGCGMCCDGTVFEKAKALPEEEERLISFGLSILQESGNRYFALPCRHHDCGRCKIYSERFSTCRSFKCALLTSYQAGEVTLEEAQSKVQQAKRLRSILVAKEPRAAFWTERQKLRAELAHSKNMSQLLFNLIVFDRFLDKWFRKRPIVSEKAPGAAARD